MQENKQNENLKNVRLGVLQYRLDYLKDSIDSMNKLIETNKANIKKAEYDLVQYEKDYKKVLQALNETKKEIDIENSFWKLYSIASDLDSFLEDEYDTHLDKEDYEAFKIIADALNIEFHQN